MTILVGNDNGRIFNTLVGFLNETTSPEVNDVVEFLGYTTSGDGGGAQWKHNGVTGQNVSQSPAQIEDALINDASGNQWALVADGSAPFEALGGVQSSTVSSHLVFDAFLASGIVGELANNTTYATSARSTYTLTGSGFLCKGKSKIVMLSAGFNATTYAGLASNSVAFSANGITGPIFKGIHLEFESHGATLRTAIAVAFRNCTNLDIDVEASGFSEPEFGVITIDSCIGGRCYTNVHDCSSNDNTLGSLQITGLEIDENRVSSVYSKDIDFGDPTYKNLTFGAAALAAFGWQTDGITLSGGSTASGGGCNFGNITVENVYEGVDIQSSNHLISGINAKNIAFSPLKLVHAARDNIIGSVVADNTGAPLVVIAGSSTASEGPNNNIIGPCVGKNICGITGITGAKLAGVAFQGDSQTYKPINNKILGVTITESPNMLYVVSDQAGLANKVYDVSGVGATGFCDISSAQESLNHVDLRKSPKTFVQAYLNTEQTGAVNAETIKYDTVKKDTYSELNLTTGVFTSVGPMKGRISAKIRTATLGTGEYIGLEVVAGGSIIATTQSFNDSTGNRDAMVSVNTVFTLTTAAKTLYVRLRTNASSLDITNSQSLTTISIEEL